MSDRADLSFLQLNEVAELLRTRQVTSVELTEATLSRISTLDPHLKSYATVMADVAMGAARRADSEIAQGRHRGPLHGVPLAVKDLCDTTDAPTEGGTTIHAGRQPQTDATVVARLRQAGAVLTGKLRMTEGAFTDHHPDLPTPVNPWDAGTWTGSSSSGSGVATAAGLSYGTLGSDTGGSIRLPSSMNGVTGLKPTWGRVSRYGVLELAASLDHIGPMARSAADCAAILQVIAGADRNDATALLDPVPDYLGTLSAPVAPRIGVDRALLESFDAATQRMLGTVIEVVRDLGWSVIELQLPDLADASTYWASICGVETAHAHAATYPSRAAEYGPALAGLIDVGLGLSAVDLQHLLERRRSFTGQMRRVFRDVDLLLLPGIGFASPDLEMMSTLGSNAELLAALLVPTAPFDLTGMPTVTAPAGFTERGTPLAFQFAGPELSEQLILQAAHAFQTVTDFHRTHPALDVPA